MPETADRTESLFSAAAALPPEERESYLTSECADDAALRDRVLALLRARDRPGHMLDRPVDVDSDQTAGLAATSDSPAPSLLAATSCSRKSARERGQEPKG